MYFMRLISDIWKSSMNFQKLRLHLESSEIKDMIKTDSLYIGNHLFTTQKYVYFRLCLQFRFNFFCTNFIPCVFFLICFLSHILVCVQSPIHAKQFIYYFFR
ncbi:hypothetical protein ACP275_09G059300 [Erythranthe tilingii]